MLREYLGKGVGTGDYEDRPNAQTKDVEGQDGGQTEDSTEETYWTLSRSHPRFLPQG